MLRSTYPLSSRRRGVKAFYTEFTRDKALVSVPMEQILHQHRAQHPQTVAIRGVVCVSPAFLLLPLCF